MTPLKLDSFVISVHKLTTLIYYSVLAKTRARTGKALMLPNEERHHINAISKVYLMYSA